MHFIEMPLLRGTLARESLERTIATDTSLFHVGSLGLIDGNDAIAWEAFF